MYSLINYHNPIMQTDKSWKWTETWKWTFLRFSDSKVIKIYVEVYAVRTIVVVIVVYRGKYYSLYIDYFIKTNR